MGPKAQDKGHRKGISVTQVAKMFATEEDAVQWFESWHWPTREMVCIRCGSTEGAYRVKRGKPMPYRCKDCKKYFSLKTGTAMEKSKLPLRMWGRAIYMELTSLRGVSAMKLHRDLGISYPSAWFLLHRIRATFDEVKAEFAGAAVVRAEDQATVQEFAEDHASPDIDTLAQIQHVVAGLVGKRLMDRELTAGHGRAEAAG